MGLRAMRSIAWLPLAFGLGACGLFDGPSPGLGGACTFSATDGADLPADETCTPDLYCNSASGRCDRFRALGEACRFGAECAEDLQCRHDVCWRRVADGGDCTRDDECLGASICNHGRHPEDARIGQCGAPSAVGGPCGYGGVYGAAWVTHGCASGLACLPSEVALPTTLATDPATTGCTAIDGSCGYVGSCAALRSAPFGAPCATSDDCASGWCLEVPPPLGDATSPAFRGWQESYVGAWPGRCADDGVIQLNQYCGPGSVGACAPGLYCDDAGMPVICQGYGRKDVGALCATRARPSDGEKACRVGLICDGDGRCAGA